MRYFHCPACNKTFVRDGRLKPYRGAKSFVSLCEETGQKVRVKLATAKQNRENPAYQAHS